MLSEKTGLSNGVEPGKNVIILLSFSLIVSDFMHERRSPANSLENFAEKKVKHALPHRN
jgi:hypothetical protein